MKIIAFTAVLSSLVTACVAAPVEQPDQKIEKGALVLNPSKPDSNSSSTASIKQQREQKYLRLLQELEQKNAGVDARKAIEKGDIHVLGYQAGRGQFSVPSIDQSRNRCSVKQIDGMGDIIYGENHLKYRLAVKEYAGQFNQLMSQYCR